MTKTMVYACYAGGAFAIFAFAVNGRDFANMSSRAESVDSSPAPATVASAITRQPTRDRMASGISDAMSPATHADVGSYQVPTRLMIPAASATPLLGANNCSDNANHADAANAVGADTSERTCEHAVYNRVSGKEFAVQPASHVDVDDAPTGSQTGDEPREFETLTNVRVTDQVSAVPIPLNSPQQTTAEGRPIENDVYRAPAGGHADRWPASTGSVAFKNSHAPPVLAEGNDLRSISPAPPMPPSVEKIAPNPDEPVVSDLQLYGLKLQIPRDKGNADGLPPVRPATKNGNVEEQNQLGTAAERTDSSRTTNLLPSPFANSRQTTGHYQANRQKPTNVLVAASSAAGAPDSVLVDERSVQRMGTLPREQEPQRDLLPQRTHRRSPRASRGVVRPVSNQPSVVPPSPPSSSNAVGSAVAAPDTGTGQLPERRTQYPRTPDPRTPVVQEDEPNVEELGGPAVETTYVDRLNPWGSPRDVSEMARQYRFAALMETSGGVPAVHRGPIKNAIAGGKQHLAGCGCNACGGCCKPGICVMADFLYWRTQRPTQPFTAFTNDGFDANEQTVASTVNAAFNWNPGIRAAVGYVFPSCWNVRFMYTNFSDKGFSAVNNNDARLLPLQAHPAFVSHSQFAHALDSASSALNLNYQTFDLEVGKNFSTVDRSVAFRLFGGIRSGIINQTTDIHYAATNNAGQTDTDDIRIASDMTGWGLRAGGSLRWKIRDTGFSVFSRGAASLLVADFKNVRSEHLYRGETPNPNLDEHPQPFPNSGSITMSNNFLNVVPVAELAVGVGYCKGCWQFNAGYEIGAWFNMVNDIRFMNDTDIRRRQTIEVDRGQISFQGLFAELIYCF